jgi:hypothetical protein
MGANDKNESCGSAGAPLPKTMMRPVSEIQNRPFGFTHQGKAYDTDPSAAEIQHAIENENFEPRGIQSDRPELDREWFEQSKGDVDEIARLQKIYNARRIAYLYVNGWNGFPIRVEANGTMHDGTHRLRAAIHRGEDKIEAENV